MKRSFIFTLLAIAATVAFAGNTPNCNPSPTPTPVPAQSISGSANISGAINNSITTSAYATGANLPGTSSSYSAAGSSASSAATANLGASVVSPSNAKNVNVTTGLTGTTTTAVNGYAYNVSSGTGVGNASVAGWADAGSNGTISVKSPVGNSSLTTTGSSDTGHPNYSFGPDVGIKVGTNQAGAAAGVAGGSYNVTGALSVNTSVPGTITGSVSDTKATTAYGSVAQQTISGLPSNVTVVNAQVLDASATSNANANGSFNVNTNVVPTNTAPIPSL